MQKAIVVDFDGTLLMKNSFEEFYRQLAIYALSRGRLKLLSALCFGIVRRKLRLISHAELKRITLLRIVNEDISSFIESFAKRMQRWIDSRVVKELNDYVEKGYYAFLSTAAPLLYVQPIVDKTNLDIGEVLATGFPGNDDWRENCREEKARRTLERIQTHSQELAVLMTDHLDDLPLLKIPKERNVLVNPTEATIRAVSMYGIPYDVVRS